MKLTTNDVLIKAWALSIAIGCWSFSWADDAAFDQVSLNESDLRESSGLAQSNRDKSRWWTHNDSGDEARLFAFDRSGSCTGRCRLKKADAVDWEDMASFTDGQQARLIVADCGDNDADRESIQLYIFDEPDPNDSTKIDQWQRLDVRYPDRPHNCEAICVDVQARKIILIAKEKFTGAGVYTLDLPEATATEHQQVVAKRITTLFIPMISAMDRDANNGDLWVINYFQAFHFPKSSSTQTLRQQLGVLPTAIELPRWKQIEAVAVDDLHHVWVTSEGKSAPLGRLNLK